jgi:dihydropyrimidinase
LPGGIDSHVQLDQPNGPGIIMADDSESGTRSVAIGGKCLIDYGFHLIIADPTPAVLGQELPALVLDGYLASTLSPDHQAD